MICMLNVKHNKNDVRQARRECLAVQNAMHECQAFSCGVFAWRYGVLAWRSGMPRKNAVLAFLLGVLNRRNTL